MHSGKNGMSGSCLVDRVTLEEVDYECTWEERGSFLWKKLDISCTVNPPVNVSDDLITPPDEQESLIGVKGFFPGAMMGDDDEFYMTDFSYTVKGDAPTTLTEHVNLGNEVCDIINKALDI